MIKYKSLLTALSFLLLLALVGCKGMMPAQWKTYPNTFDDTWNAAIRTITNMTGKEPASIDRAKGKIVTNVFYSDITETEETKDIGKDTSIKEYRKEVETYVAIITVKSIGENTKVIVSAQKGSVFSIKSPQETGLQESPGAGITFTNDRSLLNKFLNELDKEIENPTKQQPDQLIEQLKADAKNKKSISD